MKAAYVVLMASLLLSLAALLANYADAERLGRFQGIYDNANITAQMAVFTLILGWALHKRRAVLLQLVLAAPAMAVLVLAESRTAFVAVGVAVGWIIIRSRTHVRLRALYLGSVAATGIVLSGWRPVATLFDRFGSMAGGDLLGGRLDAWEPALRLIQEQPFGYGWAASGTLFESMFGYVWFTFESTSVHSSYLQFLVELGLLGLLPLLYLLLTFARIGIKGPMPGLGAGLIAVVVAGVCIQITESSMFGLGQPYPYIFWFAVAAAITTYTANEDRSINVTATRGKATPR